MARLCRYGRERDKGDVTDNRIPNANERARLRPRHLACTLKWQHALALSARSRARPASGQGEAYRYLLAQWSPLIRHRRCGITRLDTDLAERTIRPSCIGRKNWRFIGCSAAGQASAILYSVVTLCQRHGRAPAAYLRELLFRLPPMTNRDDPAPLRPSR